MLKRWVFYINTQLTMNKLNKLVYLEFAELPDALEKWKSENFQKRLKKVLKTSAPTTTVDEKEKKPERPHTPYIQFCMYERPLLKKEYPNLSNKEITKLLGEKWNKLKQSDPDFLAEKFNYLVKVA